MIGITNKEEKSLTAALPIFSSMTYILTLDLFFGFHPRALRLKIKQPRVVFRIALALKTEDCVQILTPFPY